MTAGADAAVVSAAVMSIGLAGSALWKLATMLTEVRTLVRGELKHNGGESTKDYARRAAQDAAAARAGVDRAHGRIDQIERDLRSLKGRERVR